MHRELRPEDTVLAVRMKVHESRKADSSRGMKLSTARLIGFSTMTTLRATIYFQQIASGALPGCFAFLSVIQFCWLLGCQFVCLAVLVSKTYMHRYIRLNKYLSDSVFKRTKAVLGFCNLAARFLHFFSILITPTMQEV